MNRARIGFIMQTASARSVVGGRTATTRPPTFGQTILVTKPLAIAEANEVNFVGHLDGIDSDIGIVRGITDLTLKRYSRLQQQRMQ